MVNDDTPQNVDVEQTESEGSQQASENNPDASSTERQREENNSESTEKFSKDEQEPTPQPQAVSPEGDSEGRTETEETTEEKLSHSQDEETNDVDEDTDVEAEIAALREAVQESTERIDDLETKLEDYKRRNNREHEELQKYAVEDLADEMLKVKDMLEDAIELEDLEDNTESRLNMIVKQFDSVLTSGHIERIEPDVGEQYNDGWHRMTDKVTAKSHDPGQIVRVVEAGYRTHDRVIKPARVEVAANIE